MILLETINSPQGFLFSQLNNLLHFTFTYGKYIYGTYWTSLFLKYI